MRLAPAARRRRGLNLTPMIDVVFLLLVFFMLVSRFGQLDGVPLALAGGAAPGWSGAPRLVDVRPEGLSLNGTALDEAALIADLRRLMPAPDAPGVQRHRRPGAAEGSFSILHYVGERLLCVESVNAPMDHVMSRKLMEAGISPAPAVACDPAVALKTLLG